jgi:WD40 repeat protein/DNA-binding SARP family transcriptional activator
MTLTLSFLGSFQASLDGNTPLRFRSDKSRALLAYLSVEAERPHERATLASLFWPDMPNEDALRNLSQTLSRMRDAIHDQQAEPSYVLTSRQDLQWNRASAFDLDATKFGQWASSPDATQFAQAINLYQGEFLRGFGLPDCADFETWLLLKREHYQQLALEAMQKLAAHHLARGDYAQAQHYARLQLGLEVWRETAHRQLMRALALNGHRSEALAQYEACRRTLAEELGVEPEAETTALYEQVRSGTLGQTDASAARKTVVWSEVPDLGKFHGRADELAQLQRWVMQDQCRLVAIAGMGGMGKTALAARLTQRLTDAFDAVIWRSVLNAPPLGDVLRAWLHTLSNQRLAALPSQLDDQLDLLIHHMQQRRCLLVLDNLESIFEVGDAAIAYRPGYADYGQLLQRVGQTQHQSCLIFTSRERPIELVQLEDESTPVRSLRLTGLSADAAQAILHERGVQGLTAPVAELAAHYSGNPLALKLVAETIRDLFGGDIAAFLRDDTPIFDDIRTVLDQQFERLSPLEREVLIWLTIERRPVSVQVIQDDLIHHLSKWEVLEAVRALQRRSLLEIMTDGFTPQNVIIEYATGRLVEQAWREIEQEQLDVLERHALLKADAPEYVRESQARLIVQPIGQRLTTQFGPQRTRVAFERLLDQMRASPQAAASYAAGNVLNLLTHMRVDAYGLDFSRLTVRQAYLRGALMRGLNFSGAHFSSVALSDKFGGVNALTFSPDGQLLATAPSDGAIRVWRVSDGQLVNVLAGHGPIVWSLAFTPDGQHLASGGDDGTMRLWHLQSSFAVRAWQDQQAPVYAVAISPDGKWLASTWEDGIKLRRLDGSNGDESPRLLAGHTADVEALAFSPDGAELASTGHDQTIRIWNVELGAVAREIECGSANTTLRYISDGRRIVTGDLDNTVRMWDAHSGKPDLSLHGHAAPIDNLAVSADGRMIASGSLDQTIRLWDANTGQLLNVLRGHTSWVGAVSISPDGALVASGSEDQSVRLWEASSGRTLQILRGHLHWVNGVAFSPDGKLLASGSHDRAVRVLDFDTCETAHEFFGHASWVTSVAFSPNSRLVASASEDGTVRVWHIGLKRAAHVLSGSDDPTADASPTPSPRSWRGRLMPQYGKDSQMESVDISPDGRLIAAGGHDRIIRFWDAQSGRVLAELEGHTNVVEAITFSPDGRQLASGSWDHRVILWDVQTGRPIREFNASAFSVASVAFSPDGRLLATAGQDSIVRVWNVMSGQLLHELRGHERWIRSAIFSPDGRLIVSAGADACVRVWDTASGTLLRELCGHTDAVVSAAFHPSGAYVATASRDESIRVWDPYSGACVRVLQPEGPYAGMNISGVTGLSEAQKDALKSLGAVDTLPNQKHRSQAS